MEGISPRYVQDKISNALVCASRRPKSYINPFMVLNELESGPQNPFPHQRGRPERKRYSRAAGVREGRVREHRQERGAAGHRGRRGGDCKSVCANYIDNVKAYTQREKVRKNTSSPGHDEEPDERLMRSIEEKIDIPESRKDDFRREIMNYIGAHQPSRASTFNWQDPTSGCRSALELKLFEDQQGLHQAHVVWSARRRRSRTPRPRSRS